MHSEGILHIWSNKTFTLLFTKSTHRWSHNCLLLRYDLSRVFCFKFHQQEILLFATFMPESYSCYLKLYVAMDDRHSINVEIEKNYMECNSSLYKSTDSYVVKKSPPTNLIRSLFYSISCVFFFSSNAFALFIIDIPAEACTF